jgi:glutamyl-tRNA(Gln) amidotransferase subunit D
MSNNDEYKGYKGEALKTLQRFNAPVWSDVEISTEEGNFKGLILPRSETADEFHIVLKIPVGYNIGIAAKRIRGINIFGRKEARLQRPVPDHR